MPRPAPLERVPRADPAGSNPHAAARIETSGVENGCDPRHPEQPRRAIHNFLTAIAHTMEDDEQHKARRLADAGDPDADVWGRWLANFLAG